MRTMLLTIGMGVLLMTPVIADDTKDNTVVKEIDLKGVQLDSVRGRFTKPIEIVTAEELAKVFPVKETRERIAKDVNFDRHKLVYFAWSGSGQDKVFAVAKEEGGKKVVKFVYEPGRTRDLRSHFRLFLLGKNVSFTSPQ